MVDLDTGAASWALRRRVMYVVLAFCMATIGYALLGDMRGRVAETAVSSAFFVLGSTVASYVFGAAWDDHNERRFGGAGRRRSRRGRDLLAGE